MRIILAGPKGVGKSTVGAVIAERLDLEAIETDTTIEQIFEKEFGQSLSCREIYQNSGSEFFREKEVEAVRQVADSEDCVIITGGSTLMNEGSLNLLTNNSIVILLKGNVDLLWRRATRKGLPPWLSGDDGERLFRGEVKERFNRIQPFAKIVLDTSEYSPEELAKMACDEIFKCVENL